MYKKMLMITFLLLPTALCAMEGITVHQILEQWTQELQQEQKEEDASSQPSLGRFEQKKREQERIKQKHDEYCQIGLGGSKDDAQ
jgi:hypothetical protein